MKEVGRFWLGAGLDSGKRWRGEPIRNWCGLEIFQQFLATAESVWRLPKCAGLETRATAEPSPHGRRPARGDPGPGGRRYIATGLRSVASPVPECEGPGAPSFVDWEGLVIGAIRPVPNRSGRTVCVIWHTSGGLCRLFSPNPRRSSSYGSETCSWAICRHLHFPERVS